MDVPEAKRLRQLEDENAILKNPKLMAASAPTSNARAQVNKTASSPPTQHEKPDRH